MSNFERSVTCSFSQELYSHIDKNSGGGSEDMFFIKIFIISKQGNLLRPSSYVSVIQANRSHSSLTIEFTHSISEFFIVVPSITS